MDKYFEFFKGDKFAAFCGIGLIDCKPGYAKAQVTIEPQHLNAAGVVQGGLLFTLADFAFAAAVNTYGKVALSISANITYCNGCSDGLIIAEANEISRSNKLIHCDINIKHESGELLANFKGTAYVTKQENNF